MLVVSALCTVSVDLYYHADSNRLVDAELWSQDLHMQAGRKVTANTNFIFIGITRTVYSDPHPDVTNSPSLIAMRESFPWSRVVWAELVPKLAEVGAKVIALDLVFGAATEVDASLREVLDRHREIVVVGSAFAGGVKEGGMSLTVPTPTVIKPDGGILTQFDTRVGYINMWPDRDGVVRSHRYAIPDLELVGFDDPSPYHHSLAARILQKMGKPGNIPFDKLPKRFRFTAGPGFWKPISIDSIFYPESWANNFANGEFFKGKVIIVGPANNLMHDELPTPFMSDRGEMLGPEIHLNALNAALHEEFLTEPSKQESHFAIACAGIAAFILTILLPLAAHRLGASVFLALLFCYLSHWAFNHQNHFLLTVPPLITFASATLGTFAYDFVMERLARLKLRATMEFYFSPKVLLAVIANPGSMEPREADVTLLLTDLRNSTPLAEKLGPKDMFKLLNRVFAAQTNAIMEEDGNLEHFLGDQFLSYWGAPQEQPDSADRALRAARKLIANLEAVKDSLEPEIKTLFGYGVALHHGPVLVGNKGSSKRLDYGLVGDTVNAAARIESLTKYYGVKLLVSGDFLNHLKTPASTRRIDHVIVRGKSHPVELHQVALETDAQWEQLCQRYAAAYRDYEAGQFSLAKAAFDQLSKEYSDPVSRVLMERCQLLESKPRANWSGVWEMDRK